MRTKLISPLLFLIFINLTFIGCQEPTGTNDPGPVKPPNEIISVEHAAQMYENYSERRVPIIKKYEDSISSDTTQFTPTRYAEYDLETIKQYIAFIEYEANQVNVDIKTLRFYLSNYPNSDKFEDGGNVKYPRRNSFFMLPTMEYNGKNVGFSIEDVDGNYTAVPINQNTPIKERDKNKGQSDSEGQLNEAGFFMSGSTTVPSKRPTSLILNDGQLMPPPGPDDFNRNN